MGGCRPCLSTRIGCGAPDPSPPEENLSNPPWTNRKRSGAVPPAQRGTGSACALLGDRMYAFRIADELEASPPATGEHVAPFNAASDLRRARRDLAGVCDVVGFRPATVGMKNCRYWSARSVRYSWPSDRSDGRNTKSRSRNVANRSRSRQLGTRS